MSLADAFARTSSGQVLVIETKRRFLSSAVRRNLGRKAMFRHFVAIQKIASLDDLEKAIRLVYRAKRSREEFYQAEDFLAQARS